MKLPFVQVDAFADAPFTGNPAAVMLLDAWLDDALLQAIAAENNVSETAFLIPASGDADFELRWFTPSCEVVMCGHATLASGHHMLSQNDAREVRFRTRKAGILTVGRAERGYTLNLPAWIAEPKPLPELLATIGVTQADTFWHPHRYSLIVLESAAAVRALTPDFRTMARFGDWLTIVTAPGDGDASGAEVVSRAFAPGGGIDEDPVTGSAHAVLTPYWAARLGKDSFTAYQASARGGHVHCTLSGDRVILRGECVTVIEGEFSL